MNNPRARRQRMIGWTLLYSALVMGFLFILYRAGAKIVAHPQLSGHVELATTKTQYLLGETVSYTIVNNLTSAIEIQSHCPAEPLSVYRWNNTSWVRVHDQSYASTCANQPTTYLVPANAFITGNFANWPHLFSQPGKYRIVAYVANYNALPYQDFLVTTASSSAVNPQAASPAPHATAPSPQSAPAPAPTPSPSPSPSPGPQLPGAFALSVIARHRTSISLSWTASTNATSYLVYRGSILITTIATTAYTDSSLTCSTSYSYSVYAVNSAGQTASNLLTASTSACDN